MLEKLKSLAANDSVFYSLLLVLVAVASFGLGRQSIEGEGQVAVPNGVVMAEYPAIIPQNQVAAPISAAAGATGPQGIHAGSVAAGAVVASKSGSKYHLPTCPGAKQIKSENLISFASIAEAEAAGYTAAANCKF